MIVVLSTILLNHTRKASQVESENETDKWWFPGGNQYLWKFPEISGKFSAIFNVQIICNTNYI